MDTDGCVDAQGAGKRNRCARRLEVVARRQDTFYTGTTCRGENVRSVGRKRPRLEVAVAIYESDGRFS
jgi:hypothetical protein